MITVLDDQTSVEKAFEAGATDYVTKPIHWAVLSNRVRYLLASNQAKLEVSKIKDELIQLQFWESFLREICLLYTSPSPRDLSTSRMPSSA